MSIYIPAETLTEKQISWARAHDWFHSVINGDLLVWDRYVDAAGVYHENIIRWGKSFSALRDWAGY